MVVSIPQVLFLDIAMPKNMSRDQLIKRYDANNGSPTDAMVKQMKEAYQRITAMKTYSDWFQVNLERKQYLSEVCRIVL